MLKNLGFGFILYDLPLIFLCCFFSDFPVTKMKNLDITDAGLQLLENNIVSSSTIESARFTNNRITYIEADAFR